MKMPFKKGSGGGKQAASGTPPNADGSRIIPKGKKEALITQEDPGVLRIGKKKYAVDLHHTANPEGALRDEAEKIAKVGLASSFTLYAKTSRNRVAFGSPDIGHKKGMQPLAASIRTDLLGEDWVIIALLDGGKVWYGESRGGEIIQDEIMATVSVAQDEIRGQRSSPERPIVAPAEWNIPGSTTASLSDLVGRKTAGLRKFSFLANNLPRIVIIGLVSLIVGGAYLYFQSLEAQRVQEERELAERRERRVIINDTDFPWFQKARPEAFLEACARMMNDSVRLIPGWTAQPVVCQYTGEQVVATHRYQRIDGGRIGWMREAYAQAPGVVSLDPSGNLASYVRAEELIGKPEDFSRTAPWAAENSERVIRERFQNLGLEPRLQVEVSRAPADNVERATFNSMGFDITTSFFPSEIVYLMSDTPATVPETLVWDMNANTWALTMRVYHPAILPLGAI